MSRRTTPRSIPNRRLGLLVHLALVAPIGQLNSNRRCSYSDRSPARSNGGPVVQSIGRYRKRLVQAHTAECQRIQKTLEDAPLTELREDMGRSGVCKQDGVARFQAHDRARRRDARPVQVGGRSARRAVLDGDPSSHSSCATPPARSSRRCRFTCESCRRVAGLRPPSVPTRWTCFASSGSCGRWESRGTKRLLRGT